MPQLESFSDLLAAAEESRKPLDAIFLEQEAEERDLPAERVFEIFLDRWSIMKDSVRRGLAGGKSFSGLVGGDARKVIEFTRDGDIAGGRLVARAIAYSIAVLEENSRMGIIVAAPTAGAAGMVPGTLLAISEERGLSDVETARGLVVAGGFGALVAAKAELSGAAGGCQAEQGVGAAMAAGALAFLLGGTPAMSVHAAALTLQNTLGLACDPVAGLVEVPCVRIEIDVIAEVEVFDRKRATVDDQRIEHGGLRVVLAEHREIGEQRGLAVDALSVEAVAEPRGRAVRARDAIGIVARD